MSLALAYGADYTSFSFQTAEYFLKYTFKKLSNLCSVMVLSSTFSSESKNLNFALLSIA